MEELLQHAADRQLDGAHEQAGDCARQGDADRAEQHAHAQPRAARKEHRAQRGACEVIVVTISPSCEDSNRRHGAGDLARPRRASQLRDSAGFPPASLRSVPPGAVGRAARAYLARALDRNDALAQVGSATAGSALSISRARRWPSKIASASSRGATQSPIAVDGLDPRVRERAGSPAARGRAPRRRARWVTSTTPSASMANGSPSRRLRGHAARARSPQPSPRCAWRRRSRAGAARTSTPSSVSVAARRDGLEAGGERRPRGPPARSSSAMPAPMK